MVREVEDPLLGTVLHPGIVPHFPDGPGQVRNPGPDIGADSEVLVKTLLGYDEALICELKSAGVLK